MSLVLETRFNLEIFEEGQNIDVQGKSKGKDLLELLKDGISKCKMPLTETQFLIELQVQLGSVRPQAKFGKEKKMSGHMGDEKRLSKT